MVGSMASVASRLNPLRRSKSPTKSEGSQPAVKKEQEMVSVAEQRIADIREKVEKLQSHSLGSMGGNMVILLLNLASHSASYLQSQLQPDRAGEPFRLLAAHGLEEAQGKAQDFAREAVASLANATQWLEKCKDMRER